MLMDAGVDNGVDLTALVSKVEVPYFFLAKLRWTKISTDALAKCNDYDL